MKPFAWLIVLSGMLAGMLCAQSSAVRTIHLKSGEQITGEIAAVDSLSGDITIRTDYGELQIPGEDILKEIVTVVLFSGDLMNGEILYESNQALRLQTKHGILDLDKKSIERIDYGLVTKDRGVSQIQEKFSIGNEQQVDIFDEPTAYTLEKGMLYISGLSWGFGITDRFQMTSNWSGYFIGDFNVCPKFQLFRSGNWENEHLVSIGAHLHSRYSPRKYAWHAKSFRFERGYYDWQESGEWITQGDSIDLYYGKFLRIGTEVQIEGAQRRYDENEDWIADGWVDETEYPYGQFYECFASYTHTRARKGRNGRISHTVGLNVNRFSEFEQWMYKIYYVGAVDIKKNLIFNYEIFYDPWYVEWWKRSAFLFDYYSGELETEKPDKEFSSPIHFDIGFVYALADWLRIGLHFQPHIIGIYMKF